MVLASRTVPPVPEVESSSVGEKLSSFSPPPPVKREQLLETCAQNTYVGILSQLSVLAHYSGEIFGGLLKESNIMFERIHVLNKKIENVTQSLPALDKFFNPNSFDRILQNPRAEFSLPPIQQSGIFTSATLPQALLVTYKNCFPPPQLDKMDQFMEDGKKCVELYTNPQFFLLEWIEEQKKQRLAARDQRAKRREVRKAQKDKDEVKQQVAPKHVAALERVTFDPNTGQRIVVKTAAPAPTAAPTQTPVARPTPAPPAASNSGMRQSGFTAQPPPPPQRDVFIPPPPPSDDYSSMAPPPPPPEDFESYAYTTTSAPSDQAPPPPPSFNQPAAAREPMRSPTGMAPPPPPSRDEFVPPPPPGPGNTKTSQRELPTFVPAPPTAPMAPQSVSPARSTESAPAAPPPPPPPSMEGGLATGPTTGGLAAAMLNVQLKKSDTSAVAAGGAAKKPDARTDLLSGIRGGISLKSVQKEDAGPKKKEDAPNSVAAILARRIAIVGDSDDEESDEEGDEEWD